jgi:hypothetical protein
MRAESRDSFTTDSSRLALGAARARASPDRRALARGAALAALVAALLAAGCASVQRDVLVGTAAEADFARLAALADEAATLRAKIAGVAAQAAGVTSPDDDAALAAARSEAASLKLAQPLNETYRARLAAISGDLALLASDRAAAQASLAEAQSARADEERVFLLRSRLAKKEADAEAALTEGIAKAASSSLLKAELGALRCRQGRYREALAALDEALPRLGEAERALYAPARELALSLKDAEDAPKGAAAYAAADPVSLLGLAVIAQEGTDLLDYLTGAKAWAPGPLFSRLAGSGLFGPGQPKSSDPATRARTAFFLWNLLAAREDDTSILSAYSGRYAAGKLGPVPDAPPGSWFFDAALGCVEREILSLPDGIHFRPEDPVSGAEALKAARKAAE